MSEDIKEYRKNLVETRQKVSESYDKTIITISSGALAVSFAFVQNYLGQGNVQLVWVIFIAWFLLTFSLASVLLSLFFATLAFDKAINQVDNNSILTEEAGGKLGSLTMLLHCSGAILLIVGLLLIGIFAYKNIGVL